jgi:hypothetical protein
MKTLSALAILLLSSMSQLHAQDDEATLNPGVDRWAIKTSLPAHPATKRVSLNRLLTLPLMAPQYSGRAIDDTRIPVDLGGGLHEGDIVVTQGYLHLVALEDDASSNKDGDYHIQLTTHPEWTDSCFIVEIPYSEFISAALKDSSLNAREFIREELLSGRTPSRRGSVMNTPIYVRIKGQLFYDGIHARTMRDPDPANNRYRGKSAGRTPAMHSYTAWELHPVTHIEFAPEP